MKRKIDPDVALMSLGERGREVMRLRSAVRKRRDAIDNAKCWILDEALYSCLPESKAQGRITLPRCEFLKNCERYYDRNHK
jgi:hypothetical protein